MTDKIVVLSTCGDADEAGRIARRLIEKRVAACVNIVAGVRSIYRWQGSIEDSSEHLLIIKSSRPALEALQAELRAAHSYAVPEIVALPIVDGSEDYLAWLGVELGEAS